MTEAISRRRLFGLFAGAAVAPYLAPGTILSKTAQPGFVELPWKVVREDFLPVEGFITRVVYSGYYDWRGVFNEDDNSEFVRAS